MPPLDQQKPYSPRTVSSIRPWSHCSLVRSSTGASSSTLPAGIAAEANTPRPLPGSWRTCSARGLIVSDAGRGEGEEGPATAPSPASASTPRLMTSHSWEGRAADRSSEASRVVEEPGWEAHGVAVAVARRLEYTQVARAAGATGAATRCPRCVWGEVCVSPCDAKCRNGSDRLRLEFEFLE